MENKRHSAADQERVEFYGEWFLALIKRGLPCSSRLLSRINRAVTAKLFELKQSESRYDDQ